MKKALVIVSGGMDSVTLLYDIVKQLGIKNVMALTFNYGSKHNAKEIAKAIKSCYILGVKHEIISLKDIFKYFDSSLLQGGKAIPHGHYEQENMKKTVVPFRNGILLAVAVGYAESNNIDSVYYGAHSGDHSIYPDCRRDFVEAMNAASNLGTYNTIQIIAPYSDISKVEILKKGIELEVNYKCTWTCYEGESEPCGKCGSCVERISAFIKNDLQDPLYKDKEWKKAKEYALKKENEFNNKKVNSKI